MVLCCHIWTQQCHRHISLEQWPMVLFNTHTPSSHMKQLESSSHLGESETYPLCSSVNRTPWCHLIFIFGSKAGQSSSAHIDIWKLWVWHLSWFAFSQVWYGRSKLANINSQTIQKGCSRFLDMLTNSDIFTRKIQASLNTSANHFLVTDSSWLNRILDRGTEDLNWMRWLVKQEDLVVATKVWHF